MRNDNKPHGFAGVLIMAAMLSFRALGADADDNRFGYDNYAAVLRSFVDDAGMVDYEGLKANSQKLQAFATALSKLDRKSYDKWSKKEQIAFWLNAYNGLTLKVIIDNYPIKSSFFRSRVYPKNSIRQIAGVWDKITFNVMAQDLTLGHIEHEILRKKFDEPRIHMAMVCAAVSCPPLRNEPYVAEKLDEQLDEQTRKFLSNPQKFRIDVNKATVYLSSILKWFAGDFVNKYGPEQNIAKHNKESSAVLNFVGGYPKQADKDYILQGNFKIKYLKYDWSLNEQQAAEDEKKGK